MTTAYIKAPADTGANVFLIWGHFQKCLTDLILFFPNHPFSHKTEIVLCHCGHTVYCSFSPSSRFLQIFLKYFRKPLSAGHKLIIIRRYNDIIK